VQTGQAQTACDHDQEVCLRSEHTLACGEHFSWQATLAGNNSSPRTAALSLSPLGGSMRPVELIETPRPMCARVTPAVAGLLARGSSPPTTFPRTCAFSVVKPSEARRLQLRGQPRHCAMKSARTAFPFDPLREPPPTAFQGMGSASTPARHGGQGITIAVIVRPQLRIFPKEQRIELAGRAGALLHVATPIAPEKPGTSPLPSSRRQSEQRDSHPSGHRACPSVPRP
jgi:hypothetical protein